MTELNKETLAIDRLGNLLEDDFENSLKLSNMAEDWQKIRSHMNLFSVFKHHMCDYMDFYFFHEQFLEHCQSELKRLREEASMKVVKNQMIADRESKSSSMWWKHLIAGGLAGAASRTCTAPLDRIKITLQVRASHQKSVSLKKTVEQMMREGGLRSFWRGNGVNVVKVVPEMATKFTIYDEIKNQVKLLKGREELDILDRFVAGSLAGMISQSLIFPLEVVKTRLVLRTSCQTGWQCLQDILNNKKMMCGLFRGFVPNLIGIIPYAGIDLAVYETLKKEYMSRQSIPTEPTTLVLLTCGVVSSSCGQIVSYPLNLIKTRFQAQPVTMASDCSLVSTFRTIVVTDGLVGLYRGLSANLMKVAPSVAIGYVIYEHSRKALGASMT